MRSTSSPAIWPASFVACRWASPKYLAGESYGTLRGAGIARELFANHNVEFNGLVLVSSILNYQTVKRASKAVDNFVRPN